MSGPTSDFRDGQLADQEAAVVHDKGIRQVWVDCCRSTSGKRPFEMLPRLDRIKPSPLAAQSSTLSIGARVTATPGCLWEYSRSR